MCCDAEKGWEVCCKGFVAWVVRNQGKRGSEVRPVGLELLSKETPQVVPSRQQLWVWGTLDMCSRGRRAGRLGLWRQEALN